MAFPLTASLEDSIAHKKLIISLNFFRH